MHRGHCWGAGRRRTAVTRAQAIEALRQQVPACTECRHRTPSWGSWRASPRGSRGDVGGG
ncbi:DUF6233 domain-containing protein [Streptomyces sp. NPDC054813]